MIEESEYATVHKCPNDKVKNIEGTFDVTKFERVKCLSCGTFWKVIKHGEN